MQLFDEFGQLGVAGETLTEPMLVWDENLLPLQMLVYLGHNDVRSLVQQWAMLHFHFF